MKSRSDGLTLISLYHFVCGFGNMLCMCAIVSIPVIVGLGVSGSYDPDAGAAMLITGIIGLVIGGIFLVLTIANVAVGWGLWQQREWARMGGLALAVLRLLNIPLGTVIGGLIIWYLLQDEVKAEFAHPRPQGA